MILSDLQEFPTTVRLEEFRVLILSSVTVALLGGLAVGARSRIGTTRDRRKVYRWLRLNTRDHPDASHVDTATLAKRTRLTEDRVRRICMSDQRVHRFATESQEQWSIWRQSPQSVYEKRVSLLTTS